MPTPTLPAPTATPTPLQSSPIPIPFPPTPTPTTTLVPIPPGSPSGSIELVAEVPAQTICANVQISVQIPESGIAETSLGTTLSLKSPNAEGGSVIFSAPPLPPGVPYEGYITFFCTETLPPNALIPFSQLSIPGVSGSDCVYVHQSAQDAPPDVTWISRSTGCLSI